MAQDIILSASGLTKEFKGFVAIDSIVGKDGGDRQVRIAHELLEGRRTDATAGIGDGMAL